jgi:hypothetical protein
MNKITLFLEHFDSFLKKPSRHDIVGTEVIFHVDPSSFITKFLKEVFNFPRTLVQFGDSRLEDRMCIAYQDAKLTRNGFDSLNRTIFDEVKGCKDDHALVTLLKGAITTAENSKIKFWNGHIAAKITFQLVFSQEMGEFVVKNQIVEQHLVMTVDQKNRSIRFVDKNGGKVFIRNIGFKAEITTKVSQLKMVEFYGEWWKPGKDSKSALFRIRGKPCTPSSNENIRYELIDLFANYLDRRRA